MANEHCLNCGAPLRGPYCHACGQPVKGMIRHFKSIVADFLDTVFEYDSRIWRTLLPLYFNPGRLTIDFVAGRRIRFVTPFRLAFVLLVVAFLVVQLVVEPIPPAVETVSTAGIRGAESVEAVETARAEAIAGLEAATEAQPGAGSELARRSLDSARRAIDQEAERRIDWLEAAAAARRQGIEPPPAPPETPQQIYFGDRDLVEAWDPVTNPLTISWLPDFANRMINAWIDQGRRNVARIQDAPARFIDTFLGMLPAALFVLMPIFAVLLKVFYVFTGRLYMEHMVVSLHSHSFLALAIIVSVGVGALTQVAPAGFGVQTLLGWLYTMSLLWIPAYILIMQRRVYAQGWLLTCVKFAVIGTFYTVLVVAAVAVAAVVTLVRG